MEHTKTAKETATALDDIIQINNDRIEGYEKAATHLKGTDSDLRSIFSAMALQSRQFVNQLMQLGQHNTGDDGETTVRGKIYRAWMDVKATFSGNDRKAALEEKDLSPDLRAILATQKSFLKESHDKIRDLRNRESN
jgi:Domain of unknown function (DUF2383)